MSRVCVVIGARPNYMKAWSILDTLDKDEEFEFHLVHSGQHYDASLSDNILNQLNFPSPDTQMRLGNSTSASERGS